jgi:tight adherence protein B
MNLSETLVVSLSVAFSVWALFAAFFGLKLARSRSMEARISHLATAYDFSGGKTLTRNNKSEQSIDAALKELETLTSKKGEKSIRTKLRQSGLSLSYSEYIIRALGLWLAIMVVLAIAKMNSLIILLSAFIVAYLVSYGYLNFLIKRRTRQISAEFPTALEVMYRALRSGLPLIEAIRLSADETAEPLKSELSQILRDMSVGMNLEESMQRFAKRVPTQDSKFVATVINIQSKTGGNLSGAIGNLVQTVRQREQLHNKIQSASSEALTSAKIIGGMPILVAAGMFFLTPDQFDVFFETQTGALILVACGFWMVLGVIVLRQMTRIVF